jgi:FAD:protein FMN transferase
MKPFSRIFPFLFIFLLFPVSCKKDGVKVNSFTFEGMGTVLNVIYTGEKDPVLEEKIRADAEKIENEMSYFKEESYVYQMNRHAFEKSVKIPDNLCQLIAASIEIGEISGGKFDITYKGKGKLWSKERSRPPTREELDELNDLVGAHNIVPDCESGTVRYLKEGVIIDLGGIAKGYAIDRAGKIMEENGRKDFIINYGGDMLVCGRKGEFPWKIAVNDPDSAGRTKKKIVPQNDECLGIATSGNYERFIVYEGEVFSHIIDPGSGLPANSARSVTVISRKNALTADAFATAVSASGLDEELIKKIVDKFSLKIYTLSDRDSVWKEYGTDNR